MISRSLFLSLIPDAWIDILGNDFLKSDIIDDIVKELNEKDFYPDINRIFNALYICNPKSLKIVFVGRLTNNRNDKMFSNLSYNDYSFTSSNIVREIKREYDLKGDYLYDFSKIANDGILFINTFLTIPTDRKINKESKWIRFVSYLLKRIDENDHSIIFVTMHKENERYLKEIVKYGTILCFPNPSTLNRNRFYDSRCFGIINDVLKVKYKKRAIDWKRCLYLVE